MKKNIIFTYGKIFFLLLLRDSQKFSVEHPFYPFIFTFSETPVLEVLKLYIIKALILKGDACGYKYLNDMIETESYKNNRVDEKDFV